MLITGDTGTGKELVAKMIHYNSERKTGPFIDVNASAIPDNLVESEFFGIEEGVATGVAAETVQDVAHSAMDTPAILSNRAKPGREGDLPSRASHPSRATASLGPPLGPASAPPIRRPLTRRSRPVHSRCPSALHPEERGGSPPGSPA